MWQTAMHFKEISNTQRTTIYEIMHGQVFANTTFKLPNYILEYGDLIYICVYWVGFHPNMNMFDYLFYCIDQKNVSWYENILTCETQWI